MLYDFRVQPLKLVVSAVKYFLGVIKSSHQFSGHESLESNSAITLEV
jgi:hypothetical protein